MDGTRRFDIKPGLRVSIVLKKDQQTGKLTEGIVKDILTTSSSHPHGIKVRLQSGEVGRVKDRAHGLPRVKFLSGSAHSKSSFGTMNPIERSCRQVC